MAMFTVNRFSGAMLARPLSLAGDVVIIPSSIKDGRGTLDTVLRRMSELDRQIAVSEQEIKACEATMVEVGKRIVTLLEDKNAKQNDIMWGASASSLIGYGTFAGTGGVGTALGFGLLASSGPIGATVIGLTATCSFCRYATGVLTTQKDSLERFSRPVLNAIVDAESLEFAQPTQTDDVLVRDLTSIKSSQDQEFLIRLNGDYFQRLKVEAQYRHISSVASTTLRKMEEYEHGLSAALRSSGFVHLLPRIFHQAERVNPSGAKGVNLPLHQD